ncbi:MAG: OmpH family outer membrane protein [Elusimicrobia bacterium]|nr:OmpH family outer membrane protein [Elusimicrobiota bacterium]
MTRRICAVLSFLALAMVLKDPACAMELSLEENRAQRGSAGYVDMARVFKLFPETARAKESFADAVRQAEEGVNIRKAELIRLRAELGSLKAQRENLALAVAAESPAQQAPPPPSTAAATAQLTLPGSSVTVAVTALSTSAPPGAAPADVPSQPVLSANAQALADLDARISKKAGELSLKEEESRNLQSAAERGLLDLESRKTEILLGKIHRAIMDVARREGISVVVDKNSILYGHEAVDLTEKVIQALRGG